MHARNVIAFFVWAWPSGFCDASERWEYPEDAYSRLDFASPPYISSSLGMTRPFTNGVEWGWKKCTDPMVGGARSITLYDACTPSSE